MQHAIATPSARNLRFGSGGVIMHARTPEGLALDDIRARAPSIFADDKHTSRSERYTYIPTADVLRGLINEGFKPFEVRQGGSRDEEKRGFTKHMIRLRREPEQNAIIRASGRGFLQPNESPLFPEVVMVNAHDGTSSYQLFAGLYRLICSNGLIAGNTVDHVKVPHKGDVVHDVIEGAFRVVDNANRMVEDAREMGAIQLDPGERQAFARAALALRYDEGEAPPIAPAQLLEARRSADTSRDLWTTFNVVQEHMVKGGDNYVVRDNNGRMIRRGSTRPVNGIDGNRDLNRALHTLADEMRKLKAA